MKTLSKIIVLFFLMHLSLSAVATGSLPDIITVDGEKWYLLEHPLFLDSLLCDKLERFLPEDRSISSSNWCGYLGHWEIIEDYLYLKGVEIDMNKDSKEYKKIYSAEDLKTIFAPYYTPQGIKAKWVSDNEFTIARGDMVIYFHNGFYRYHEEEQLMTVNSGKITSRKHWRNSVFKEGMDIEEVFAKIRRNFCIGKYPILKGRDVFMVFKDIELNLDGSFKDCLVSLDTLGVDSLEIKDQNHPIIVEIKDMLRKIYPWKVYLIRGNYMPKQKSFPLILWSK